MDVKYIKIDNRFIEENISTGVEDYMAALDYLKSILEPLGMTYIRNGSRVNSLQPGQWCIKSYTVDEHGSATRIWPYREVWFHDDDAKTLMLLRLMVP